MRRKCANCDNEVIPTMYSSFMHVDYAINECENPIALIEDEDEDSDMRMLMSKFGLS